MYAILSYFKDKYSNDYKVLAMAEKTNPNDPNWTDRDIDKIKIFEDRRYPENIARKLNGDIRIVAYCEAKNIISRQNADIISGKL